MTPVRYVRLLGQSDTGDDADLEPDPVRCQIVPRRTVCLHQWRAQQTRGPTVFGKKSVNESELARIMDLLYQAARTPDRAVQDGPIAEADELFWKTDKTTAKAFLAVSPPALLAIEAVHMSSVTGETVESATNRLDAFIHKAGDRGYKVFWYPRPVMVIGELRKLGDYLTTDG